MNPEYVKEESNSIMEKVKKAMIWMIAIFISMMLLLVIIFQPRFFSFVQ